jgi:hypothetical protein
MSLRETALRAICYCVIEGHARGARASTEIVIVACTPTRGGHGDEI